MSLDLHKDFAPSLRSLQSTIQKRSSGNQFLHSHCSVEPGGRGRGRPCLGLRFAFNCPSSSSLACPPAAGDQKVIITIPVWKLHCPPSPRRQIKCSGSRLPTPGNYTPRPAGRPGGAVSQQAPGRSGGGLKFLPDWNLKCPEGSNSGPTTKDLPFLSFANRLHHGRFGALRRRKVTPTWHRFILPWAGSYAAARKATGGPARTRNCLVLTSQQ